MRVHAQRELRVGVAKLLHDVARIAPASSRTSSLTVGRRWDRKRIFRALEGRDVSLVALTHVHGDHNGSQRTSARSGACPSLSMSTMSRATAAGWLTPQELADASVMARFVWRYCGGPAHRVDRVLQEGTRPPASASSALRATAPAR